MTLTIRSARELAARLVRHPHAGSTWSARTDRDLARESEELMALAQLQR